METWWRKKPFKKRNIVLQIYEKWKVITFLTHQKSSFDMFSFDVHRFCVTNWDLCNVIGTIDIQVFINKARNFRSVYQIDSFWFSPDLFYGPLPHSCLARILNTRPLPLWRRALELLNCTFCNNKKHTKFFGIQITIRSSFISCMFALFWPA